MFNTVLPRQTTPRRHTVILNGTVPLTYFRRLSTCAQGACRCSKIQASLVKGLPEKNTLHNLRKGTQHGWAAANKDPKHHLPECCSHRPFYRDAGKEHADKRPRLEHTPAKQLISQASGLKNKLQISNYAPYWHLSDLNSLFQAKLALVTQQL